MGALLRGQRYNKNTTATRCTSSSAYDEAAVSGYAQRGSDDIDEEGFAYWEDGSDVSEDVNNAPLHAPAYVSVPSNAKTVEADGTVMEACLTGLRPNTKYQYVAFVKTVKGDMFYGVQRTFATGQFECPTEIISTGNTAGIEAVYDMTGRQQNSIHKGLNIIRMGDGSTRKVVVK